MTTGKVTRTSHWDRWENNVINSVKNKRVDHCIRVGTRAQSQLKKFEFSLQQASGPRNRPLDSPPWFDEAHSKTYDSGRNKATACPRVMEVMEICMSSGMEDEITSLFAISVPDLERFG